jgi:hypothetical protein
MRFVTCQASGCVACSNNVVAVLGVQISCSERWSAGGVDEHAFSKVDRGTELLHLQQAWNCVCENVGGEMMEVGSHVRFGNGDGWWLAYGGCGCYALGTTCRKDRRTHDSLNRWSTRTCSQRVASFLVYWLRHV